MSFLLNAADRLNLTINRLNKDEQKLLLTETFRDIHKAALRSLIANRDGESLELLDGGSVRLQVCNWLKLKTIYKESDIREMLSNIGDCKPPDYKRDVFQVGWLPYYHYTCFWHIQVYKDKRLTSVHRLPTSDLSKFEFRVILSAEYREPKGGR